MAEVGVGPGGPAEAGPKHPGPQRRLALCSLSNPVRRKTAASPLFLGPEATYAGASQASLAMRKTTLFPDAGSTAARPSTVAPFARAGSNLCLLNTA